MYLSSSAVQHLLAVADLPDLTGTRYDIESTVASGGMGTVYRARDRELDRIVALKVLHAPAGADLARRMLDEARILASLEHPAIVPVHDAGTLPDGRVFYAMKYVDGPRLDRYLRDDHPLPDRLRVFERICEAVAFAHAQGVVHRDLKPANVMVGRFGEVLVMDWGIAKRRADEADPAAPPLPSATTRHGTEHGAIIGTPGYMSPEQERGDIDRIDQRADVYALGAMLREVLASADTPPPRALTAIVDKAQERAVEARYQSVDAMRDDVGRYLAGLAVAAMPEGILGRATRVIRNYRTPILLVLAYLVMRLVLILWFGR